MDTKEPEMNGVIDSETQKVLSLLDYLEKLHAQRNAPVRDFTKYKVFRVDQENLPDSKQVVLSDGDPWLTVDFVDLPPRPPVPKHLETILGSTSSLKEKEPPNISFPHEQESDDSYEFDSEVSQEEAELIKEAKEWVESRWKPWAFNIAKAKSVKALHKALLGARDLLQTDSELYELVWGFGILSREDDKINYPVVTVPVKVSLNTDISQLTVSPTDTASVESLYLAGLKLNDSELLDSVIEKVSTGERDVDPWSKNEMQVLLRDLVRAIDHNGALEGESDILAEGAVIRDRWSLFIRRRHTDYLGYVKHLRELYSLGSVPSKSLQAIVADTKNEAFYNEKSNELTERFLLPLPSNEEQEEVIELAQRSPGITVQGPPGTGKSHTIANIICHHLAYGRRVLVVAEKEPALNVLENKIPRQVRDLTISVLGKEAKGEDRREASLRKIRSKVNEANTSYEEEIEEVEKEIEKTNQTIAVKANKLYSIHKVNASKLDGSWIAGKNLTPMQAAKWVKEKENEFGYIPDPIAPNTPTPLSLDELHEYVSLLGGLNIERAEICAKSLPALNKIPTPKDLNKTFSTLELVAVEASRLDPFITNHRRLDEASALEIDSLKKLILEECERLKSREEWVNKFRKSITDDSLKNVWTEFTQECYKIRSELLDLEKSVNLYKIILPEELTIEFEDALKSAQAKFFKRDKLSIFSISLKKALNTCTVNDQVPHTEGMVSLVIDKVTLLKKRKTLHRLWNTKIVRVDGPVLDEAHIEEEITTHLSCVDDLLNNEEARHLEISKSLDTLGIKLLTEFTSKSLEEFLIFFDLLPNRDKKHSLLKKLRELDSYLASGKETQNSSNLWGRLQGALVEEDLKAWDDYYASTVDTLDDSEKAILLLELHKKLESSAPIYASKIADGTEVPNTPENFTSAWEWTKLSTWVDKILLAGDSAILQTELESLSRKRLDQITYLVSLKAWYNITKRFKPSDQEALATYFEAIKKYGKGTGKYRARRLAHLKRASQNAISVVPVWIMAASQALTHFKPAEKPVFDVLIIDEASQLGLEALPLLGLADSTIIVGDDMQVSPANVGLHLEPVFRLMKLHLSEIQNYEILFDPTSSLYQLAITKFYSHVMLTEHFRSLPEIIGFSNFYIYNNQIIPLRKGLPKPDWRPLGVIRVSNGYREGNINPPEAQVITDLVAELCDSPDYEGMTFGVISLLGHEQGKLIYDNIYDHPSLGPKVMEDRNILIGDPARFQGDERDIIIISVVAAFDPSKPQKKPRSTTIYHAKQRLNVAASRARNQMWVVHSIDANIFSEEDLRAKLISYCNDFEFLENEAEQLESKCESVFEKDVLREILKRGYKNVRVQHKIGQYRIDITIEGPGSELAIECDGDRFHPPEVWDKDRRRQGILERAGWTFQRISGTAFYRNGELALEPLWAKLKELDIPTGDEWRKSSSVSTARTVEAIVKLRNEDVSPAAVDRETSLDEPLKVLPDDPPNYFEGEQTEQLEMEI